MYDYHLHSHFSGDCNEQMEETIKKAIEMGGKHLCFTDHLDYDYPTHEIDFEGFDEKAFTAHINQLQDKYSEIKLQKGVELGLQTHLANQCDAFVKNFDPDFVLCSFHVAKRQDLFNGDFYENRTPEQAWLDYYEDVYNTLNVFKSYCVVGHLDIPKRYNEKVKDVDIKAYESALDKVLIKIIEDKKGIEVNMSGLRTPQMETLPNRLILQKYFDLGGSIITIGSDAHRKEDIYSHFKEVLLMLQEIGFEYLATYEKMKMIPIEIKTVLEKL
ncbi:MAG: histidinol-phosphatase HisJ family protein [Clostridia bacterium]|nr:histidinol-phosphatase HisJ family protein [Clostridia bacterium]